MAPPHSTARKIAANLSYLLLAEAFDKGLRFVVVVYLARILGAAAFGILSFAQALLGCLLLLVNLGLETLGARDVARDPGHARRIADQVLSIRLVAGALTFLLFCAVAWLLPKDPVTKRVVFLMGFFVFVYAVTLEWFFRGLERMHVVAVGRVVNQVAYAVLALVLVAGPADVVHVPLIRVGAGALAALLYFGLVCRGYGRPRLRVEPGAWGVLLRQSVPIGLSVAMITVYTQSDTIILSFLKSDDLVGWYSAAYRIVFMICIPANIILTAFFPALSRIHDMAAVERVVRGYVRIMLSVGLPLGLAGLFLAEPLVRLLYGESYLPAVLPLQILFWNATLVFLNVAFGNPLLAWGRQMAYTKFVAAGALANVALNFLLIPRYGMAGAAGATVLAECAVFAGVYPAFQKQVVMPLWRTGWRPLTAALAMAGVMAAGQRCGLHFLLLAAAGGSVYLFVLALLGGIGKHELALLMKQR